MGQKLTQNWPNWHRIDQIDKKWLQKMTQKLDFHLTNVPRTKSTKKFYEPLRFSRSKKNVLHQWRTIWSMFDKRGLWILEWLSIHTKGTRGNGIHAVFSKHVLGLKSLPIFLPNSLNQGRAGQIHKLEHGLHFTWTKNVNI